MNIKETSKGDKNKKAELPTEKSNSEAALKTQAAPKAAEKTDAVKQERQALEAPAAKQPSVKAAEKEAPAAKQPSAKAAEKEAPAAKLPKAKAAVKAPVAKQPGVKAAKKAPAAKQPRAKAAAKEAPTAKQPGAKAAKIKAPQVKSGKEQQAGQEPNKQQEQLAGNESASTAVEHAAAPASLATTPKSTLPDKPAKEQEDTGMKVLYVASEALPFIASGGLGDVAGSLPKAIQGAHHTCRVVVPLYGDMKPEWREKLHFVCEFTVELAWRRQYCGVFEGTVNGVKYYFIDNEYYFRRTGLYGFFDDGERFAFFSKAVVDMLPYIDYKPNIIHCNDWQTALVPVYLNCYYRATEFYRDIKTVFTIHNIQYQGQYSPDITQDVLGLPKGWVDFEDCCNFMCGAITQADMVTTVSPTYANEILDEWYAHGLDKLLREKSYKLCGIINGIDTTVYNPQKDPLIYKNFSLKSPENKAVNKQGLQKDLGLSQDDDAMLIGIVTRLVSHKGVDLIKFIFKKIIENGMEVAVLGSGDYIYENFFQEMASIYPGRVAVRIGFDTALAHKIYAGSDVLLMPSKSEPCGLAQMIALRYGTIPVVRKTGGLADSIIDMGDENGNGYTFQSYNAHDMFGAIKRAQGLYYNKPDWERAVKHAMECDCSWARSAKTYVGMYEQLLAT